MMKNLIDPRLPRAVLRAAILETFVALSDKWIFEVCCHASSQDSSLCPSDVSRLKIARLFLASITFVLIVFIEKIKDCQMSNVHSYVRALDLYQNSSGRYATNNRPWKA